MSKTMDSALLAFCCDEDQIAKGRGLTGTSRSCALDSRTVSSPTELEFFADFCYDIYERYIMLIGVIRCSLDFIGL